MENKSKESNVSINIIIAQAKQEYINMFNQLTDKYQIPASIWEMILSDVLNQVKDVSKQDLAYDLEMLKKSQEKEDETKDEGNKKSE